MTTLILKSWNVLHGVHEFNYAFSTSPVLIKYQSQRNLNQSLFSNYVQDENKRIYDLSQTIQKQLGNNCVMCLQEVPGDLLNLLKAENPNYNCLSYKYSRQPKLKNLSGQLYNDQNEYLVTMIPTNFTVIKTNTIQFDDPGKACFVVELGGFSIMNTHLSFGEARNKALDQIFKYSSNKFALVGDMNMNPNEFKEYLKKSPFSNLIVHHTSEDTRKGAHNNGHIFTSKLDYYVAPKGINFRNVSVNQNDDQSDHCLITALIGGIPP